MADPTGRILYYDGSEQSHTEHDIFVVDPTVEEYLTQHLALTGTPLPLGCFAISEENLCKYGPTFSRYFSYRYGHTLAPFRQDTSQTQFFERWEQVVLAFNAMSPGVFSLTVQAAGQVDNAFFPFYGGVLRLLSSFSKRVMAPVVENSPFLGRNASAKPWAWQNESVSWLQELRTFVHEFENFKSLHLTTQTTKIQSLGDYARRQIGAWEGFQRADAATRCYLLSAFLYGTAEVHLQLETNGLALICLHRALDLYLQSWGLQHHLMVQTVSGLRYSGSSERVSILNSLEILVRTGAFVADPARDQLMKDINDERNRLILAHGVYTIIGADLRTLMQGAEAWINRVEGHNRWSQTRGNWFPLPKMNADVLFELEPSMGTYVREITVP